MKLATEAPVNGGRNYDGPKVNRKLALVKLGYMLESLSISRYSPRGSDNALSADNQQERPNRDATLLTHMRGVFSFSESSETIRQVRDQIG